MFCRALTLCLANVRRVYTSPKDFCLPLVDGGLTQYLRVQEKLTGHITGLGFPSRIYVVQLGPKACVFQG